MTFIFFCYGKKQSQFATSDRPTQAGTHSASQTLKIVEVVVDICLSFRRSLLDMVSSDSTITR